MRPGLTSLVTYPAAGGAPIPLSTLAHVSPPRYSWAIPGGCAQLSATLFKPPRWRHEAIRNGRQLAAIRGGSVVWSGWLDEPQPTDSGWQLQAHGAGGEAVNYRAIYSAPWASSSPNDVVDQAITRGLDWIRVTDISGVSGLWIGQAPDSASSNVGDVLSTVCHKGGLTWEVRTLAGGNYLYVFALPTVANRLLVATGAVPTTVTDGADVIYLRYQATWDTTKTPATYATTSVLNQPMIDATGRREDYADLSSAGTMSSGSAQTVGNNVLKRFTRAAFTEPFVAGAADLLNMGGSPVDPGVFYADGLPMVCKLLFADFAYGGEIAYGSPTFLVGSYEWDDAALVATITPFESIRHDFSTLLATAVDTLPVRSRPTSKTTKKKKK